MMTTLEEIVSSFFRAEGFTGVTTPTVLTGFLPEPYIDLVPCGKSWYRPSPELEMKILLSGGAERIFEIGPCWRAGESGRLHRSCFTMLEWYDKDRTYTELIPFTRKLLVHTAREYSGSPVLEYRGTRIDLSAEWQCMSLDRAFTEFADTDLDSAVENGVFEEALVSRVEPSLPRSSPVVLKDYPAEMAAYSRLCAGKESRCERWELYIGGIEIANTYTELTDIAEHKRRFREFSGRRKDMGLETYPESSAFLEALERGMPESAGCALGLDRLMMILDGRENIRE